MRRLGFLTTRREFWVPAFILIIGAARVCFILWSSIKANGGAGFPLDDPWIHLQFARNLREFGSFSFYRNEMVTSGSTSPLYTILLAIGFFFTSNEMLLSYVLGITFLLFSGIFFLLLVRRLIPSSPLLAEAGLLLFLLEPRMEWAALSGMETTLFIAGILACFYFFAARNWRLLAISLGVLLWIRPDGLLLIAILSGGAFLSVSLDPLPIGETSPGTRVMALWVRFRIPACLLLAIAAAYVCFNEALSGSAFPNTFSAKVEYDLSGRPAFPSSVLGYLSDGHMIVIAILAVIGIALSVRDVFTGRRVEPLLLVGWIVLLFLAYWRNLPFLYQEGRYMMPAIPTFLLLGLLGASEAGGLISRKILAGAGPERGSFVPVLLLIVPVVQFSFAGASVEGRYAEACRFITGRQVKTARWIRSNLPADAVVGTHDIGAIGYYSGRRVVDMVGLITPKMIPGRHNTDSLKAFLVGSHATYIAVLRSWMEVVNVNPVFQTDESSHDVMEVFLFDPARIHLVARNVFEIEQVGLTYLAGGDAGSAIAALSTAVRMDPNSSRLYMNLGLAYLSAGKISEAETSLDRALVIFPGFWKARIAFASAKAARGNIDGAIAALERVLRENPRAWEASAVLANLYSAGKHDTATARLYLQQEERIVRLANPP